MNDSLGDRMKQYEDVNRFHLPTKMPVIIRLDGKAFHSYAKDFEKPFDQDLMNMMNEVAVYLCKNIQNAKMAYTQSDEISILLVDYEDYKTSSWFDANIQKIVSVSAGMASAKMTELSYNALGHTKIAVFDSRVFVLPQHEVNNYYIWRQQDWERNSIQMLAQSLYSHKELQGKNSSQLHELCYQKGKNWADLHNHLKNGRVVTKREITKLVEAPKEAVVVTRTEWHVNENTPIFKEDRDFINKFVNVL